MVNGFAGQIVQMDLNGKVLAVMGKPGQGPRRVRRGARHGRQPEGRDLRGRLGERDVAEVREEVSLRSTVLQFLNSEF